MKVCVIGVGNIGMRYVQGITGTNPDAEVYLVDSPTRLRELEGAGLGNVKFRASVDDVDAQMDIIVVSTSCEPRLAIYKRCLELNPRYIILEKYLFGSRDQFEESRSLKPIPTFVNQWMFGSRSFHCLFEQEATLVEVRGSGWGLACNSVHWIDILKRHLKITDLEVGSGTRIAAVVPSKRAGYDEILGELAFRDRDSDKAFTLVDSEETGLSDVMEIRVDDRVFVFDYAKISRDGRVLSKFPYFSDLVGGIVGELLETGSCHLPRLDESVSQHLLVEDILDTLQQRPNIT